MKIVGVEFEFLPLSLYNLPIFGCYNVRQLYFLCVLCDTKGGGVFMVAIGCSFEACLMSLTCKYEILENPMSTVGAPTLRVFSLTPFHVND